MKIIALIAFFLLLNSYTLASNKIEYSIGAKGHTNGLSGSSKTLDNIYFDLADKELIKEARLNLDITYSSLLKDNSFVKILINDIPLATKSLNNGKYNFSYNKYSNNIRIPKSYIHNGQLKLTIQTNANIGGKDCQGSTETAKLINILPSTGVIVDYKNVRKSISNHLKSLNQNVNIFLGQEYQSHQYFDLIYYLKSNGHKITLFRKLDKETISKIDISLASKNENTKIANFLFEQNNMERTLTKVLTSPMQIYFFNKFNTLFLNSDTKSKSTPRLFLSLSKFSKILKSNSIAHNQMDKVKRNITYLSLEQLNISTNGKSVKNGKEWNFSINPSQLRAKKLPKRLKVSLTATPSLTKIPNRLSIFQNEQLLKTIELNNTGQPQAFNIELPPHIKSQRMDYRILVQFDDNQGQCGSSGSLSNVTLLPDTRLVLTEFDQEVINLAEINYVFDDIINVYLPKGLNNELSIYNLYSIINSYGINPLSLNFETYEDKISEAKNTFILVSNHRTLDGQTAPLTSESITQIKNDKSQTELSYLGLDNISVTQLVKINKTPGINVHYIDHVFRSNIDYITFDKNDILISDKNSQLLRLNTKDPNTKITSFAKTGFFRNLYIKYKYVIFFIAWLVLTLLFVRLGQKAND